MAAPREGWWLCYGDKLQEQGSARAIPLVPCSPGSPRTPRDGLGAGAASEPRSRASRAGPFWLQSDGASLSCSVFKGKLPKAAVLAVTCQCHP